MPIWEFEKKDIYLRYNGIQWTMFNQLDDLDFADDIALLSHSHQQMQEKLTQVERRAAETGLLTFLYQHQED